MILFFYIPSKFYLVFSRILIGKKYLKQFVLKIIFLKTRSILWLIHVIKLVSWNLSKFSLYSSRTNEIYCSVLSQNKTGFHLNPSKYPWLVYQENKYNNSWTIDRVFPTMVICFKSNMKKDYIIHTRCVTL